MEASQQYCAILIPASGYGKEAVSKRALDTKLSSVQKDISNFQQHLTPSWKVVNVQDNPSRADVLTSLTDAFKAKHKAYIIYFTGHGEEGTGKWVLQKNAKGEWEKFGPSDLLALIIKTGMNPQEQFLQIFPDCCYSNNWAEELKEIGTQVACLEGGDGEIAQASLQSTIKSILDTMMKVLAWKDGMNKGTAVIPKAAPCSFDKNKEFHKQVIYGCRTCWGMSQGFGFCSGCSAHHPGHDIYSMGEKASFKCDCGMAGHKPACSRSSTGTKHYVQQYYRCDDCFSKGNEGCCIPCAQNCHKGHALRLAGIGSFYCDCGLTSKGKCSIPATQ